MSTLLEKIGPRRRFVVDAAFVVVMAILFSVMYSNLQVIQEEILVLFVASYAILGLGIVLYYLLSGMNTRVASLAHVGTFPLLSIFVLFGKWMPEAIAKVQGQEEALSIGLLVYVLMLIVYLIAQLLLHQNEPEPERVRQFRSVAL